MNQISDENINKRKKRNKLYFSFSTRVFLYMLFFLVFMACTINFGLSSLTFVEENSINYTEKSNLNYQVYLKKNDFYETEYLDMNMFYVSSLIDKVRIRFNYSFTSDENATVSFDYKIVGKLSIVEPEGKNVYFEKEYVLLENRSVVLDNRKVQNINEAVDVNYDYYNSLANKFKTSYGVNAESNFSIYFIVEKHSKEVGAEKETSQMFVNIPLSEKSVNISMDYQDINNTNKIVNASNVSIDNEAYFASSIVLLIVALILLLKAIRLLMCLKANKSAYDKYVSKLLLEYDRVIVETTTAPALNTANIIKINKFQELLDVRDNLKLPIMHYVVTRHEKCYFYIIHENNIYLNTVKAVDLVEQSKM